MKTLSRSFYTQPTLKVARELLGKTLYHKSQQGVLTGKIVETESYLQNDKACHASRGMTPRNKPMFGPPGHAYVYFTYGMHHCFNVVTRPEGIAEAVLFRAVEPLKGIELMKKNRNMQDRKNNQNLQDIKNLTNGPAKLCQAFSIDKNLNETDMTRGNFVVLDSGEKPKKIHKATRIGIREDADKLWRFYMDSTFVSFVPRPL